MGFDMKIREILIKMTDGFDGVFNIRGIENLDKFLGKTGGKKIFKALHDHEKLLNIAMDMDEALNMIPHVFDDPEFCKRGREKCVFLCNSGTGKCNLFLEYTDGDGPARKLRKCKTVFIELLK